MDEGCRRRWRDRTGLEERPSEEQPSEEQATLSGDSVEADHDIVGSATVIRRRRGGMSDAAVSGIDDDIGGNVGVLRGER